MTALSPLDHDQLDGRESARWLGLWSARLVAALSVVYAAVLVAGFSSIGTLARPVPDPYLAIAEVLILVPAPALLALVVALDVCAPPQSRAAGRLAVAWMLAGVALTMTVHFVSLLVARRVAAPGMHDDRMLFGFTWPSVTYALDILAWDGFVGLSLLFAAATLSRTDQALARKGLLAAGLLCLLGLAGPIVDNLAWRGIGIAGYCIALPLTCVLLARNFQSRDIRRA